MTSVFHLVMPYKYNEKLARKVLARCRPVGNCLLWEGATIGRESHCYGQIWNGKASVGTHRVVLEWALGRALKPGEEAAHACHCVLCCNPKHIHVASHHENLLESERAGRLRRKVTREVEEGILQGSRDGVSSADLAEVYGCSVSAVRTYLRRDRERRQQGTAKRSIV